MRMPITTNTPNRRDLADFRKASPESSTIVVVSGGGKVVFRPIGVLVEGGASPHVSLIAYRAAEKIRHT